MKKAMIISLNENEWGVKMEDGTILNTFSSSSDVVPMAWDKKFTSKEFVAEVLKDVWGMEVIESVQTEAHENEPFLTDVEVKQLFKNILDPEPFLNQEEVNQLLQTV